MGKQIATLVPERMTDRQLWQALQLRLSVLDTRVRHQYSWDSQNRFITEAQHCVRELRMRGSQLELLPRGSASSP